MEKKIKVRLDADQQGHILSVLADYHTVLNDRIIDERFGTDQQMRDLLYSVYLLGNIEGRCFGDCLTTEDLEMIDAWEDFMIMMRQEALEELTEAGDGEPEPEFDDIGEIYGEDC